MYHDLTKGSISRSLLLFALPMMAGNLLQQFYNIADTLIVGRVLGKNALAAVGSSYTLMTFLTSIFLGLSMGSGTLFSIYRGKGDERALKSSIAHACGLILAVTLVLNAVVYIFIDPILSFLRVPEEVWGGMREYLLTVKSTGKLYGSAGVSCGIRDLKHRVGSFICGGLSLGNRWCGLCDDLCPVCIRDRYFALRSFTMQKPFSGEKGSLL